MRPEPCGPGQWGPASSVTAVGVVSLPLVSGSPSTSNIRVPPERCCFQFWSFPLFSLLNPPLPGGPAAGLGPHRYFSPAPKKSTVKELLIRKRQVGQTQRCVSNSPKTPINHRALPVVSEKQPLPGREQGQQHPGASV